MKNQEFIDIAKIYIKAGDGGNGCMSFRREKYIPFGGPDGGNGGKGGDIYLKAKTGINTLTQIALNPHIRGNNGVHGKGSNLYGKKGEDTIIYVPCGTIVKEDNKIITDLQNEGDSILIAKGGKGGRGNLAFKTHKNNAPKFCENGEKGEEKTITLELNLLADVGLCGFPNAGKSTLLASSTKAKPKIANYPFTTINPNLGIVNHKDQIFLMADIPGLIEKANEGKGLGHYFLRHILRTKIILHLIDPLGFSNIDPIKGVSIIENELKKFSPLFSKKEIILVLNKSDLSEANKVLLKLKKKYSKRKIFLISAITKKGLTELYDYIIKKLPEIQNTKLYETENEEKNLVNIEKAVFIEKKEENLFYIYGKEIEKLTQMTNFSHLEGVIRLVNIFKKIGLVKDLKKQGLKEGDTLKIGTFEFNWSDKPLNPRTLSRKEKSLRRKELLKNSKENQ